MKKIYFYNKDTFEFIGEANANLDPVATKMYNTNVYALPAHATFTAPPKIGNFKVAIYDRNTDTWTLKESYKGNYKLNAKTGAIAEIRDNAPLKSYEYIINKDILDDVIENPIKYDVIGGKVTDISKMQKYQNRYNIRKYNAKIQEAKEAYVRFQETPVDYKGMLFLPRYIDDYAKLANRTFPLEIWDYTGTKSKVMTESEFNELKSYLEKLDNRAYANKKNAIKKYKLEIAKLERENG